MEDEVKLTIRIPVDIHRYLVEQARKERRSLNAQIVHLLEKAKEAA